RLIALLREAGYPAVVSGAGPSILVLATDPSDRAAATTVVERATLDDPWQAFPLAVDFMGCSWSPLD
ncbi:MAG TPA: homoserine kinase, partial [Microbacteriaceae bacterium]|nr:homoserine kinase [Microbacteriaceae bacterium]